MEFVVNEERLDLCCNLLVSEVLKHPEQEGIKLLSFKTGFFRKNEAYKKKAYNRGRQKLMLHTWSNEDIGTGTVFKKVLSAIGQAENLVDWHTQSIKDKANADMVSAEKLLYELYKQDREDETFDKLVNFFGSKYDFITCLMFFKDDTKYLPCVPTKFADKIRFIGITSNFASKCTWKQYQEFLNIIKFVRQKLKLLLPSIDIELIDAHSFVWSMYLIQDTIASPDPEFEDAIKGQMAITSDEWVAFLQSGKLTAAQIEKIVEIYKYPNHSATCKRLGDDNEKHPSSFISPFVLISKTALKFFGLNAPKRDNGENTYWPVLFLGRYLSSGLFEWKIRSELVIALEKAELAPQYVEDIIENRLEVDNATAIEKDYKTLLTAIRNSPYKQIIPAETTIKRYVRDPKIKEIVKWRSEGSCDLCGEPAPFYDRNGKPYLECHHVQPLADGGTDTIDNVVALCPNCHRKIHALCDEEDIQTLRDTIEDYLNKEKFM